MHGRRRELEIRNQELERTKDALEETLERFQTTNERLERFAYAAFHDLQEPLRMVSSYLRLLENRHGDELDKDAIGFPKFAVDDADRMRGMVTSLLEYSQVSTLGEPLEPTDTEMVIDAVLDGLQGRVNETDATTTTDELPTVNADAEQLALVFENLLSNALTYSGDAAPRVHVSAKRTDEMWQFSVTNEGTGIHPELHNQIFTVFENLNANEDLSDGKGAGIGLALTEQIIERHGGDIWVDSEVGEGGFSFSRFVPEPPLDAHYPVHRPLPLHNRAGVLALGPPRWTPTFADCLSRRIHHRAIQCWLNW